MNETETRVELIDPALKGKAGWVLLRGVGIIASIHD